MATEKKARQWKDKWISIIFVAPTILLILFVSIVPMVIAFRTSLHDTNYGEILGFVGLKHYKQILLTGDGWNNIFNTILYAMGSLVVVIPLGVMAAVGLNNKLKCVTLLRTLIILPWVLSQTVVALLWKWLLNGNFGPVSYVWFALTGEKADFFNTAWVARITVILVNVWFTFPIVLILTLAALQSIPLDLFEAAKVDGASRRDLFWKITLPMIRPTILTAVVMQSMEYFSMVTLIFVMTAGGPFDATETISLRAFKEGFTYWHLGLGSAFSIVIFVMNILFSLIYVRILRNKED